MGYAAIAMQVVEFLKPYVVAGGGLAAGGAMAKAGEECWDWLKGRFTKPAQAEAIRDVIYAPSEPLSWEALKVQLQKALKDDESFRNELLGRLPKEMRNRFALQAASAKGSGNAVAQAQGENIQIQINRPGR
ncbi:MAG: hypothetical protein ABSA97_12995 [Verrucomicrobiia bacterium]